MIGVTTHRSHSRMTPIYASLTLGSSYSLFHDAFKFKPPLRVRFKQSDAPKRKSTPFGVLFLLEASPGFEPGSNGFADRGLTAWL